jgi:hypothetical protein
MLVQMSMLIGLKKQYPESKIIWIGEPSLFDLVRYNKRVHKCLSIHESSSLDILPTFFHADICINPSQRKQMQRFTGLVAAKKLFGFGQNGPVDGNAEFFGKIINGEISTNKSILDLYYGLAGMKWKGEGYGLSYYPRTKQNQETGIYLEDNQNFSVPKKLFGCFDTINRFSEIVTDDLFVLHASLALRKKTVFVSDPLPYKIYFFNNGKTQTRQEYEEERCQ